MSVPEYLESATTAMLTDTFHMLYTNKIERNIEMSFIDKILDKMSLNSEDDEEFDNEDYYLDDEEEEELPRNPFRRKKRLLKRKRP